MNDNQNAGTNTNSGAANTGGNTNPPNTGAQIQTEDIRVELPMETTAHNKVEIEIFLHVLHKIETFLVLLMVTPKLEWLDQ